MKNKKEKLVVILLVVGLIVMTVAISYAAFRFTQTGSVLNQITTGSITMSYTESSNVISMTGALPTTDATGKVRLNEGEYFDFTVGSSITGTANINFEIAAQELDGNTIDGSYIKYYLTKINDDNSEEEVMAPSTYTAETSANEYTGRPANMMSLYEGSMSSSTTVKYRLRLYVDESYNPQGDGGNLIYKVRVNVYGLTGDKISTELAPGAYDVNGNLVLTWEQLTDGTYYTLTDGVLSATRVADEDWLNTDDGEEFEPLYGYQATAIYVYRNDVSGIVLDESVESFGGEYGLFHDLSYVVMGPSVTSFNQDELGVEFGVIPDIYYTGTEEEFKAAYGVDASWVNDNTNYKVICNYVPTGDTELTVLSPTTTTPTLFDEITFANVIEGQGYESTEVNVVVNAYGIETEIIGGEATPEYVWSVIQNQTPEEEAATLEAGAYYTDGTFKDWATLKAEGRVTDTSLVGFSMSSAQEQPFKAFVIPSGITTIEDSVFSHQENLSNIYYFGTQDEWNAIEFGDNWNNGCPEITVHCTDGDIVIPANQ